MRRFFKGLLWFLLIAFIVIQFFRPDKNQSEGPFPNEISVSHDVPAPVQGILQVACNDCHSDNTRYPWYSEIQPIAWWLSDHVKDGKRHLNFSQFSKYPLWRQFEKLDETRELVEEGAMPLNSYTWAHSDARLSAEQKKLISDWTIRLRDTMRARWPADSLVRKN